jgi:hypothetical protein
MRVLKAPDVGMGRLPLAVAAGFDAAANDPIGGCEITPAGFAHMTHQLLGVADGRLILALEVRRASVACARLTDDNDDDDLFCCCG